jgi:hypothetical protein
MTKCPEHLTLQSVVPIECAERGEASVARRRRRRSVGSSPRRRSPTVLVGPWCDVSLRATCNHMHDSTTRYDHDQKLLSFLLVCPICGIERVVETMKYEPRFHSAPAPEPADASAGATVYELPVRSDEPPSPLAA